MKLGNRVREWGEGVVSSPYSLTLYQRATHKVAPFDNFSGI